MHIWPCYSLVMIYSVTMQVKKHLKNGKNVSMGFGFLEFDSVETAANICRDLQVPHIRLNSY